MTTKATRKARASAFRKLRREAINSNIDRKKKHPVGTAITSTTSPEWAVIQPMIRSGRIHAEVSHPGSCVQTLVVIWITL